MDLCREKRVPLKEEGGGEEAIGPSWRNSRESERHTGGIFLCTEKVCFFVISAALSFPFSFLLATTV